MANGELVSEKEAHDTEVFHEGPGGKRLGILDQVVQVEFDIDAVRHFIFSSILEEILSRHIEYHCEIMQDSGIELRCKQ